MTDKEIFCPYHLAKRLKDMGINHPSRFYYVEGWKNPRMELLGDGEMIIADQQRHAYKLKAESRQAEIDFIPAYTACELGNMLPKFLPYNECNDIYTGNMYLEQLFPDEYGSYYECIYRGYSTGDQGKAYSGIGYSEAESRAYLVISLIERGKINIDDVNIKQVEEEAF